MKRLVENPRFWAVLGAILLIAAVSGSAFARQMDSRNVPQQETRQDRGLTTSLSPLPTPEPENEIEPARVGNHADGNSNGNEDHGNVSPKDHSVTVNSNNNNSHDDHGGSVNFNDKSGNEERGGNINSSDHNSHSDRVSNGGNDHGGKGQ